MAAVRPEHLAIPRAEFPVAKPVAQPLLSAKDAIHPTLAAVADKLPVWRE
jgi:hypothetical protein